MLEADPEPFVENQVKADFKVYCQAELKRLAARAADKENLPLSEWVVKLMAEKLGRKSLASIPRKKMGRPRAEQTA